MMKKKISPQEAQWALWWMAAASAVTILGLHFAIIPMS